MTREDAIEILSALWEKDILPIDGQNALVIAIKALEAPPNDNWEGYSKRLWKSAYERGKADAEQRWIPVSERLPDKNGNYLVTVKKGYIAFGIWVGIPENWTNVIAWMPLPEPMKAES